MNDDTKQWTSVLMPIIKNLTPTLLAADILGVQPMFSAPSYEQASEYTEIVPDGYLVVNANREVSIWIEEQPLHMWKHGELTNSSVFYDRYIISEQLFTWLKMRWE